MYSVLWWVEPHQQPSTQNLFSHYIPSVGTGERIGRPKARKLMGFPMRKRQLNNWGKVPHASKAKNFCCSGHSNSSIRYYEHKNYAAAGYPTVITTKWKCQILKEHKILFFKTILYVFCLCTNNFSRALKHHLFFLMITLISIWKLKQIPWPCYCEKRGRWNLRKNFTFSFFCSLYLKQKIKQK